jgi:RNA polymerase sigma factor (TIGR02999 family)
MREGDVAAREQLAPLVYDTLHRMAANCMRRERRDHTLQPTALVHEAYLRLLGDQDYEWQDRAHFLAVASQTMRHFLIDYARSRVAGRRGGVMKRVEFHDRLLYAEDRPEELLALNTALERLQAIDERQARVVELRFFGGLSVDETAEILGVSSKTVKRDWAVARAWLRGEITGTSK